MSADHRFPLDRAIAALPPRGTEQYAVPFRHGTLELGLYAPRGSDAQDPHTRDELYVVMRGAGWFVNGPARTRFAPGDALFVPAGVAHRFEEFTDDFVAWVVFYGPEGGEHG